MMARMLAQAILATSLLQLIPADAGTVEQRATLPVASLRTASLVDGFDLLAYRLPRPGDADRAPKKIDPQSLGVVTSAVSATVVDRASGEVLFEKNADEPRSIGSITKLMTALLFLEGSPKLDATAALHPSDVRVGGVQHVRVNDPIDVRDLLHASLVGSDNSATAALVRLSGMPEGDFVARMNERASELGMGSTTFVDPTGLSAENRSTVGDLVRLIDETMKVKDIREATQMATVSFSSAATAYRIESTNELLGSFLNRAPYSVIGGKTGFLPEAGYCFGAAFSEDGRREIIVVVLGSGTEAGRFQDAKALTAWAYKTFDWPDENAQPRS
jgi:D-alanyl-D-alanine carboxypeptidase